MFHYPRRDPKIGSSVSKNRWQGVATLAKWLTDSSGRERQTGARCEWGRFEYGGG